MNIEEKKEKITEMVKEKLDENNIRVTSLQSYVHENALQRDGSTRKDVIITSFTEPFS